MRALVLDGAVDPARSSLDATVAQAQGFQGAFGSFAPWCLAVASCPLGGSVPGAEAKVEALITRANSDPLVNRLRDGQVADGAMLLYGVADALYSWPTLEAALASAFAGDGTGLPYLIDLAVPRSGTVRTSRVTLRPPAGLKGA